MLRLKGKLPQSVKEVRSIADKKAALQKEIDRIVESSGAQLTVASEKVPGEEVRRITCYYSTHKTWNLQSERGSEDMELAQMVLNQLAANQQNQPQQSQPPQGRTQAKGSAAGSRPAAGGRPGPNDMVKPGGPPEDASGQGPGSVVAGGG